MGIPGSSFARKIPGIGTILSAVGIRAWVAELRAFGISRLTDGYNTEAAALKHLMTETGFIRWARFWHYGRTQIPLTKRLFAEQVFSDLGKPWSDLVTGFGVLGKGEEQRKLTKKEALRREASRARPRVIDYKRIKKKKMNYYGR